MKFIFRQQTVKWSIAVSVDGVGIGSGFQKQLDNLFVIGFLSNKIWKIASSKNIQQTTSLPNNKVIIRQTLVPL